MQPLLHRLPFLSAAVVAVAVLTGCGRTDAPVAPTISGQMAAVQVATVKRQTAPRLQPLPATVEAIAHAVLSAQTMGRVSTVNAVLGQTVAAGELLATLDAPEMLARRDQARAALAQVEQDLARERGLFNSGASTAEGVRTLDDRRRIATAALAEADAHVAHTSILAPFAGRITVRSIEPGDFAAPGTALFTLEGSALRVVAAVPASLTLPSIGSVLDVSAGDAVIPARLAELAPAVDTATRTRRAQLDLPAGTALEPGQFIRVLWPAGEVTSLVIPASALTPLGQMERVFAIVDGRAQLRIIRTGTRQGDLVTVTGGLSEGEIVVIAPATSLRDGHPVDLSR